MAKPSAAPLAGRVVVVAGADTGEAAGAARTLAAAGAALVLVGADAHALGTLAAELRESGTTVSVFSGSLSDAASGEAGALGELVAELFVDLDERLRTRP